MASANVKNVKKVMSLPMPKINDVLEEIYTKILQTSLPRQDRYCCCTCNPWKCKYDPKDCPNTCSDCPLDFAQIPSS